MVRIVFIITKSSLYMPKEQKENIFITLVKIFFSHKQTNTTQKQEKEKEKGWSNGLVEISPYIEYGFWVVDDDDDPLYSYSSSSSSSSSSSPWVLSFKLFFILIISPTIEQKKRESSLSTGRLNRVCKWRDQASHCRHSNSLNLQFGYPKSSLNCRCSATPLPEFDPNPNSASLKMHSTAPHEPTRSDSDSPTSFRIGRSRPGESWNFRWCRAFFGPGPPP